MKARSMWNVGADESTDYLHPVTSWPDSDPLGTIGGGKSVILTRPSYQGSVRFGPAKAAAMQKRQGRCSTAAAETTKLPSL